MALVLIPGDNAIVEFSEDGSTFKEVSNTSSISTSGGEAPESDIVTFGAVGKITGRPRVPTCTIALSAYLPHLPEWATLTTARNTKKALQWRFRTVREEIFASAPAVAGDTVAIADTGVLTFAGDDLPDFSNEDLYGVGMVLESGGESYVIITIDNSGAAPEVTVWPAPANDIAAAADYEIVVPALQLGPFVGTIRASGNFELAPEAALSSSLELGLRAQLPPWKVAA